MNMEEVKAVSYYYKKGDSEGYDRATLDAMYTKAREKYPNLQIVEYLCDNNKNLTAYDRVIELIADCGIRCILTPSLDEASYATNLSSLPIATGSPFIPLTHFPSHCDS